MIRPSAYTFHSVVSVGLRLMTSLPAVGVLALAPTAGKPTKTKCVGWLAGVAALPRASAWFGCLEPAELADATTVRTVAAAMQATVVSFVITVCSFRPIAAAA
jgi:hypothetical protein